MVSQSRMAEHYPASTAFIELASTESLIDAARSGHLVLLTNSGAEDDEGVLVLPAHLVTPDAVNFMATHAGGIICLTMTEERVKTLAIPSMPMREGDSRALPHAASIEARLGVTTGISAADRAHTIRVAINHDSVPDDLVSPGHVFPCTTRNGGVLVRSAFAEASVDIARLAGLNPSAVVCKVLDEDGEMARGETLRQFARQHNLQIGSIRDLITYRRRTEKLIERTATEAFTSATGGHWILHTYRDSVDGKDILALVKGEVTGEPLLVRVHSLSVLDDVLGRSGDRGALVSTAMNAIEEEGRGVLVLMPASQGEGETPQSKAMREYGLGAQVLGDLGANRIVLLKKSNLTGNMGLEGFGLEIVASRSL